MPSSERAVSPVRAATTTNAGGAYGDFVSRPRSLRRPDRSFARCRRAPAQPRGTPLLSRRSAHVARLDAGDLVGLATASPADAAGLLEVFCHRVATLQSQLVELAFANVRTRLGPLRISTTREQVSALLAEFRARGLVQYQRAEPMRIYPERLMAIVERV